jgi:glycosyltransferase involved in cell wall biosynthesis
MKIAYVYDAAYPYVKGGIEKRVYEIGRRLSTKGHEVHWFSIKWWDGPDNIKQEGINMHGVCRPIGLYNKEGRRSIKAATAFALKVAGPLSKERYDIIDCQNFPYLSCLSSKTVSLKTKTPLVITWHEVWGDYWYSYMGKKGFFGKQVENACSRIVNRNITVSERTKNKLIKLGVKKTGITILPNGTDIQQISSIAPSEEKYDVLYAGRLIKDKNIETLIKSLNGTNVRTCIIGEGPEKEKLVSIAGKNVLFLPFQERTSLIAYMKSAKVFVLPSTREGFGITALEALACGTPLITTDHPDNAAADLIEDGKNGYIVTLDEKELRKKIDSILTDDPLRKTMGENAKRTAIGYSWEIIAEETLREYLEIIDRSGNKRI